MMLTAVEKLPYLQEAQSVHEQFAARRGRQARDLLTQQFVATAIVDAEAAIALGDLADAAVAVEAKKKVKRPRQASITKCV